MKGEATVTAYPNIFSGVIQPIYQQPIRKVIPIDGKVTIDFDILSELKYVRLDSIYLDIFLERNIFYTRIFHRLADDYKRLVMIDVAVEESLTGRRQNTSMEITLHKHKYTMDLIKTSEYYKPGLKYTAFVSA